MTKLEWHMFGLDSREQQNDVKCLFRWCWQKSGTQITGLQ